MSHKPSIAGALLICASSAIAQECAVPGPTCAPAPCCQPSSSAAPANAAPANPGRFVRGPSAGAATGESNTLGLRGPVIHIPEIRLQLPHIEFAGLYKIRHDATKIFNSERAAFVEDAPLEFDNVASPATAAPAQATPANVPYYPPACTAPVQCTETEQSLKALEAQLARLEVLEKELLVMKKQQVVAQMQQELARQTSSATVPQSVASERPAVLVRKPVYEMATYQEEVVEEAPVAPQAKRPVSAPPTRASSSKFWIRDPNSFGDWAAE